jgi:hypothetical protein
MRVLAKALLPVLIVLGACLTLPSPAAQLLPTLLAAAGLFALLFWAKPSLKAALPVWIFVVTFAWGYYAKAFLASSLDSAQRDQYLDYPANYLIGDAGLVRQACAAASVTIFVCCVALVAVLVLTRRADAPAFWQAPPVDAARARILIARVWGALLLAQIVTGWLQYTYSLAIMGTETVTLPFHLAAVIVYSRIVVIPYLLLVLYDLACRGGLRHWPVVLVATLALHGLAQSVLMSSRAMVLYFLLPVFFHMLLGRGLTWRWLGAAATFLVLLATVHPLLTSLRLIRMEEEDRHDLSTALARSFEQYDAPTAVESGLLALAFRFTGFDGLLTAMHDGDHDPDLGRAAGLLFDPHRSFSQIYTQDIAGYGDIDIHTSAPGLLGAFHVLGGYPGMVLGVTVWTVALVLLWRARWLARLITAPAARSALAFWVLYYTESGSLDMIPARLAFFAAAVVLGEGLASFCASRRAPPAPLPASRPPSLSERAGRAAAACPRRDRMVQ